MDLRYKRRSLTGMRLAAAYDFAVNYDKAFYAKE